MADDLLSYESMNDDEDGGASEDEYDALNDETFGGDGDGLDWEEEHEQLAHITESSRHNKDHLDLEASLSRLVLDEEDVKQPTSSLWPPPPQLTQPKPGMAPPPSGLKNVCTVEELERQMRQQAQAQQSAPQNQQNYFQPRFPVILQRPPGLSGPVPLPFNPGVQINHNQNINQIVHNNQMGQQNQLGHQGPPNQMGHQNQLGHQGPPNQMGQQNQLGHQGPPNQMGQQNQLGHQGPPNQMGQQNQLGHQGPPNQMGPNQLGPPNQIGLNQFGQQNQLGPPNQMGPNMGPPNHIGPQFGPQNQLGQTNHLGPPNQQGNQMGPMKMGMNNHMGHNMLEPNRPGPMNQMGLGMGQPTQMNGNPGMGQVNMMLPPHLMPPRMMMPQPINNMQRFPNQPHFSHNFRGPMDQQNKPMMNQQHINKNPNQMHQQMLSQQGHSHTQVNKHKTQEDKLKQQRNNNLTSQNLVELIQSTHPMLVHGSIHNANNHPMLRNNLAQGHGHNHRTFVNSRYTNGLDGDEDVPEDEYAGLMSQREKQWLLNIQMLQLNTGTPYIEDYYYTVWQERKARKEREGVKEAHKANQQNHPLYSGGNKQENRERHRHNSSSEEQPTPRTYVPTQFENSLGKLQCGSVTAPRKIIDVEVVREQESPARPGRAPSVASTTHPHEGPREVRRAKQTLLDIEALYLVLLRLEEINDPLAIANALVLKEREEKAKLAEAVRQEEEDNLFLRNIESVQRRASDTHDKVADKRQVVSLNPATPETPKQKNLLDENKAELVGRLFAGLTSDDRLQHVLCVRKGKVLVRRFLSVVSAPHPRLRALWGRALRALPHAARRDREDALLPRLAPYFQQYIATSSGWAAVIECSAHIAEILDPARTPHALLTPLTLTCVNILLERASTLMSGAEATANERQWSKFLKSVARALKHASVVVARPRDPLSPAHVTGHVRLLESRAPVEILQRGRTQPEFDLARNELAEILLKYLC